MESKNFQINAVCQIRYKQLLVYNKFEYAEGYGNNKVNYERHNLKLEKTYSGKVTVGAKKRMAKAIDTLLQISPQQKILNPIINKYQTFQLTFLTLTISDDSNIYDAKYCYKNLLNPILSKLKKQFNVSDYIWKLELQKRGQIHYHITTNKFIDYSQIRNEWNMLQNELGILEDYKLKYKNSNPNSTDIHAVYKVQDIKKYLLKYLSKESQNERNVNGKIWDCSENLKKFKPFEIYYNDINENKLNEYKNHPESDVFKNEHCEIVSNKAIKVSSILNTSQIANLKEHIFNIKNYSTQKKSKINIKN